MLKLNVVPLLVIGVAVIGSCPATDRSRFALALLLRALTVTVVTPREADCDALIIVMVSLGTLDVAAGVAAEVADAGGARGEHEVDAGTGLPGQGLSCPTIMSVIGGETPYVPGTYGPEPLAR